MYFELGWLPQMAARISWTIKRRCQKNIRFGIFLDIPPEFIQISTSPQRCETLFSYVTAP